MRRSLLYQLETGAHARRLEDWTREVQLAEELGIDRVWCLPGVGADGDFSAAAPEVWLAALAARTRTIRIGWGLAGMTPPAHPPIRTAEQGAALDLASKGRLDVALLPGPSVEDESDARDWREGIRMLVDMWDRPAFSWTSPRFEVPPVDVLPKPVQHPHPPLLLVGWSQAHARAAGRGGLGYVDVSGGSDEVLEVHRDLYVEGRAEADPEELVCEGRFAAALDLVGGTKDLDRIVEWERVGLDEVVLRTGPLEGGHGEAMERIRRFGGGATSGIH